MRLRASRSAMVIVDGTDIHHDLIGAALALQEVVIEAGLPAARAVGMDRFVDPMPATAEADAYVVYRSSVAFDPGQQRALSDLVATGKGLVVLHASNLFGFGPGGLDADRTGFELVGSRYISHGDAGSEGRFAVEVRGGHPVTRHLDDFEIDDEYYVIEHAPDVQILAERTTPAGPQPLVYVREHGLGRVCYIALGHDGRAWGNPGFRQLVRQATLWAARVPEDDIASWSTRWPLGNGRTIEGDA
ncbi:ThuA domain-containing protein [Actinopolymorpha pittospori]|uniref:Type 1 glutamine amidotransferase n=1 Tax=Actinopolymorpha pittospori TaxID=648752 RepID=A0A927MV88_9ACTN|nr:ThuA domain-containing protein [Actinopolymorpha pittospori]MBE1605443.1 type 1 glutamine amidotransferase [Actinopolymorpha pittospori]